MSRNWDKHLQEWQSQGFLSHEQAAQIRDYESNRSGGSRLMLALTSLAALSIGLGIISVIAANWELIPVSFKLVAYFSLMTAQILALWRWDQRPGWVREGLHVLYMLGILAGIGLIAQIFHVPSDGWRGIALWSALSLGLMLRAESWYPIVLWIGSYAGASCAYVFAGSGLPEDARLERAALAAAVLGIFATWQGRMGWPDLQRRLLLGVSCCFVLLVAPWGVNERSQLILSASLALIWLELIFVQLRSIFWPAVIVSLAFLARCLVVWQTTLAVENFLEALFFFIELTALGAIALKFQQNRIFDALTLVMAARLLTLFFTVFGTLFATGTGLILFGVVVLGLLHLWYRYRQKFQAFIKDRLA